MIATIQSGIPVIDVEQLALLVGTQSVRIIDVRLPFDYFGGRVPGSMSLPGTMILERVGQILPDERLVFISEDGAQCVAAAKAARAVGFRDVAVLGGGYDAWIAEDRPVETISDGMF